MWMRFLIDFFSGDDLEPDARTLTVGSSILSGPRAKLVLDL
jgi:hypothetical protein